MSLLNQARLDLISITTNDAIGFSQDVTFAYPDGSNPVTVKALFTEHHNAFDTEGVKVSAKIASVAVSEVVLNAAGYVTENGSGVFSMEDHRVTTLISTGSTRTYVVGDKYPDRNLGLLVLMLTDFE
jgi:hypothetical protein